MSTMTSTAAASAASNANRARRVYVMHSMEDAKWALEFTEALHRMNVASDLDRSRFEVDISSFGLFERHIERSDVVIAIFPVSNVLRSKLRFEIDVALAAGKILVPIITRDVVVSDAPATSSSACHVVWRDTPDRSAISFVEVVRRLGS